MSVEHSELNVERSAPKGAVFLSYASQDAEAAKRIADALRAAGVEVWFDQSELRGGDSWDAKIRKQIRECALFVPIISAKTQLRLEGYFRLEWKLAEDRSHLMAKGRPFILPVAIDATTEREAQVPDAFLVVQWTTVSDGDGTQAFAANVLALLDRACSPLQKTPSPGRMAEPISPPTGKSVAVLAFANLSDDKGNEYFSDGVSEELLNVLCKVPGLKVSARTSAFSFKGRQVPIAEIARQLGVAYVIEGSVRKAGDRVRITAQLIKAADGFQVWSETFTRDLKDIFAVQDEIAGLIAGSLSVKLGTASQVGIVNPAAYQLFLQGRAHFNREVLEDYRKAIECYQASLAIDPDSALTWAWLAMAYLMSGALGSMPHGTGFAQSRDAARRAIALDPNLAPAYAALGAVLFSSDWDWKQSEAMLVRATELAPGDAGAISLLSNLAQVIGQTERALHLGRRALELDPLNTMAGYIYGKALFQAGRFADLEKQGETLVALNPGGFYGYVFLTYARLLLGRISDAAKAAEQVPVEWARLTCLAHVRKLQGREDEAEAVLAELKAKHSEALSYQIAEVHATRREPDQAFEWLEIAFRQRDPGMTWLKNDSFLKTLHDDVRWPALLRKMKLSDDQLT